MQQYLAYFIVYKSNLKTMKRLIYTLLLILVPFYVAIASTGNWKVYNCYNTYLQLEEFHGLLYVRSGNAVFYTEPEADTANSFTRLDGLSSSRIQFISKSEEADALAFIHQDGIIDIMNSDEKITSIFDLKNKTIAGNKTINHVTISGDKLYLACGFGFVEVNLRTYLITNYHFTSSECEFAFSFEGGIYYALAKGGLWRADDSQNLAIESNWQKISEDKIQDVTVFTTEGSQNCWVVDQNKDIHILNPDGSYKKTSSRKCYEHLKASGKYVFSKGWGFDIIKADNQEISYVQQAPFSACRDYYSVSDSIIYAVHPEKGLLKLRIEFNNRNHAGITQLSESNNYFEIAGSQISELAYSNGILAGISGYKMYSSGYTDMYLTNASVSYLQEAEWTHISEQDILQKPLASKEFRGLTNIAADPLVRHRFYVGTLTTGLYQFDADSLSKHFFPNERITAVNCDEEGNLWAAKAFNDITVFSYNKSKDQWIAHFLPGFEQQPNIGRMIVQANEPHRLIWVLNNYPYQHSRIGILYNPSGAESSNNDQSAYITTLLDQDGNQYSLLNTISTVYDLCEDKDGAIWLLTNIGPFVIEDVVNTFNHAQKNAGIGLVKRVKVPRNDGTNLADYLLSTSQCTAMAVDQYNRKWIGTMNEGVYLLSADGIREIAHFTSDNAPLHSNSITSLVYDEENNRLFIACEGGIVIYHADEVNPSEDFSALHCFPNPLRPDYYGDVEILGLMEHTQVSITDTAGNLIWKTFCEDGNTSWNGRDNSGVRVAPGVYLIHAISKDSSKGEIIKLLVL